MKIRILLLSFTTAALVAFAMSCTSGNAPLSKTEMKAIVEKQNKMLEQCFINRDAAKLAMLYTDSAKLSPNGGHFVIGRDSIRAFWAEDFKIEKVLKMTTTVLNVEGNAAVIYETGISESEMMINDTLPYRGHVKYINVWKQQPDGSYQLDVDFWNKDAEN